MPSILLRLRMSDYADNMLPGRTRNRPCLDTEKIIQKTLDEARKYSSTKLGSSWPENCWADCSTWPSKPLQVETSKPEHLSDTFESTSCHTSTDACVTSTLFRGYMRANCSIAFLHCFSATALPSPHRLAAWRRGLHGAARRLPWACATCASVNSSESCQFGCSPHVCILACL